ncbi:MAG: DDE-type integrase/transposase/recombinase [Deltaproteobacteria bacterium]|nr:DDE-type integrase/transposase/recombinase [Deltaproteobacteria bacterium]
MTEEQKKQLATFRFGVIHDLVNRTDLDQGDQAELIRDKCSRRWNIPFSGRTRISRSTVLRWMQLYRKSNGRLESLYPLDRADRGESRTLDDDTVLSLIRLRQELPRVTIVKLIKQMHERGLVPGEVKLNSSTVYRLLNQRGLMQAKAHQPEDRRKFEAELANDIWQSDVMHGPMVKVGDKMRKTYLIAFLDDHSRLVPHGEFYLSEALNSYLDALEKALLKRGLPRKLYVDNGAAFRSHHLEQVCASLGIALIHARPYKPQGKGKIERFFRTVREDFLAGFQGQNLDELNCAYSDWLKIYHEREHRSTGQCPFERFTAKMECLRPAPANLSDHFRKVARRRVAKDRTLVLEGNLFEAPVCLIGKQVQILYHQKDPGHIEIMWEGKSYGYASAVDLHVNCRVKRDRNSNLQVDSSESTPYKGGSLWEDQS